LCSRRSTLSTCGSDKRTFAIPGERERFRDSRIGKKLNYMSIFEVNCADLYLCRKTSARLVEVIPCCAFTL
jgi:hypothetical protein